MGIIRTNLLSLLILALSCGYVQAINYDSLWGVWNDNSLHDTTRLKAMKDISWKKVFSNPDTAYILAEELQDFAEKSNQPRWQAEAKNTMGASYFLRGQLDNALEHYLASLNIRKDMDDLHGISRSLNNIALVYRNKGELDIALTYYEECIGIQLEMQDEDGLASTYNNLGIIHMDQGNIQEAIENHTKSMALKEKLNDRKGLAGSLNNIAMIYEDLEEHDMAISYYNQSLQIKQELEDKNGIAYSHSNIGIVYNHLGDKVKAVEHYEKALEIRKEIDDQRGISTTLTNLGSLFQDSLPHLAIEYFKLSLDIKRKIEDNRGMCYALTGIAEIEFNLGNNTKAKKLAEEAYDLSVKIGHPKNIMTAADILRKIYKKEKKFELAYVLFETAREMADSLQKEENQAAILKQNFQYEYHLKNLADSISHAESDKLKEAELAAKDAELKKTELELHHDLILRIILGGVLILVIVFAIFMVRRFKHSQAQKAIIEDQKEAVEAQNEKIEQQHLLLAEHHKEISDSIVYAKRIQDAILPSMHTLSNLFADSFIYFRPKDVVSGDFYWIQHSEDKGITLLAVGDCTGHGVPGALVSVVCHNALNRSVKEFGLTNPADILNNARKLVLESFSTDQGSVNDGMDIALCAVTRDNNKIKLQYAGANNPLWLIRNDSKELVELKADRQPVGRYAKSKDFTSHEIELHKGDQFYLFSDGFPDQFGGPKGKKFMARRFKEVLLQSYGPLNNHLDILESTFNDWKGGLEQIDDVCVMGVTV